MKKILYIFILAALAGAAACTDLLEDKSYTNIPKDEYMNNAKQAETVLLGVYRPMSTNALYGYNTSMLFTLSHDLAQCEGSASTGFREIPTNAHNANNAQVLETWGALYKAIYGANDFMEQITERMGAYTPADQATAEIYIAEAKALRALYYFELLRWYGHIVLMETTADSYKDPKTFAPADPVTVFEFIEKDLKDAALVLDWNRDKDRPYRFSKGAALGLLAKVYATWAGYPVHDQTKWALAAQAAGQVVTSGKHSLLSDYKTVWDNACNGRWNGEESLIEASFYSATVTGNWSVDCIGRVGKWTGVKISGTGSKVGNSAGNVKVVYTFIEKWKPQGDAGDLRFAASIADYQWNVPSSGTNSGVFSKNLYYTGVYDPTKNQKNYQIWTPRKWDVEQDVENGNQLISNDYSNINWYVLRYADVLLLYAEALNESDAADLTPAYDAINQVRRRGYGKPVTTPDATVDLTTLKIIDYTTGGEKDDLRQAIRDERAYELCFEGHRRQDLVRWGIYYETVQKTGQSLKMWFGDANYTPMAYTTKTKHDLFPIPQRELDLMGGYNNQNNPGW